MMISDNAVEKSFFWKIEQLWINVYVYGHISGWMDGWQLVNLYHKDYLLIERLNTIFPPSLSGEKWQFRTA